VINKKFYPAHSEDFIIEKNHMMFSVLAINSLARAKTEIDFVYDPGASVTIINRNHFDELQIANSKIEMSDYNMGTYGNSVPEHIWRLPYLFIGGFTVTNIPCFTPSNPKSTFNLLGLTVLAHFNQFIDMGKSKIYFELNEENLSTYNVTDSKAFLAEEH